MRQRRFVETILHVSLLYLTLYERGAVPPSTELFTSIFLLFGVCHGCERLRWQMAPLVLGYVCFWFSYVTFSAIFCLVGVVLCHYMPLPKSITPIKGAFDVGYFDYEYRSDTNERSGGTAIGRLFYPTLETTRRCRFLWSSKQAYFFHGSTSLLRALVKIFSADIPLLSKVPFLLDYWALVTVPIKRFATPLFSTSSAPASLPVVIFSHGLSASRELNTSLCLDLASMGFFVFAVEHTDGT